MVNLIEKVTNKNKKKGLNRFKVSEFLLSCKNKHKKVHIKFY